MKVELIYERSCPNILSTRSNLLKAFSALNLTATWSEWDKNDESTSEKLRAYGSPTVLVDGRDIYGEIDKGGNDCCRIYENGSGTPSIELIESAFRRSVPVRRFGVIGALASTPGIGAAFLAKAACPLCYPAIAGFLSSLGLGFLFSDTPLIILTSVAISTVLFGLWFKAKSRRGFLPLLMGIIATLILIYAQYANDRPSFYLSGTLLIIASIWNLIPVRSCGNCASAEASHPHGT